MRISTSTRRHGCDRTARSPALRESAWSLLPLLIRHSPVRKRQQAGRTLPQCGTSRNPSHPLFLAACGHGRLAHCREGTMSEFDLIVRRGAVVLPSEVRAADVGIAEGRIVAVQTELGGSTRETTDATGLHVFPGVIDSHVHF